MPIPEYGEKRPHYKQQVAQRFDRAALTYDGYADFQKIVLERLFSCLPSNVSTRKNKTLEIGTGTGQALTKLSAFSSALVALDLSWQMLEQAKGQCTSQGLGNTNFVCGDAEALPFADAGFDLLFSSLAFQWCLHPLQLFSELYRVTKPGGYLVFSTLCEGSMPEIERAWQGIDDASHINHYHTLDALKQSVETCHWCVKSAQSVSLPMWFESPKSAIDSLKKVGASLVVNSGEQNMSRAKWKRFIQQYEGQRKVSGIPLSYQVGFVVLRKPLL